MPPGVRDDDNEPPGGSDGCNDDDEEPPGGRLEPYEGRDDPLRLLSVVHVVVMEFTEVIDPRSR